MFFLHVLVDRALDRVDFSLDLVEAPLLRFLHLDHHFLNLFELLETVCLHFFKLFLLVYKHLQANVFV